MATMISEVFTAFKSAGVDDEKAQAAAEAMSAQGERLTVFRDELRQEIRGVRDELRQEIRDVRDELRQEIRGVREELGQEIRGVRDEARQESRSVRDEARQESARLRGSVRLLQWQMLSVFALLGGLFWMLFRVAAKVGALPG